MHVKLTVDNLPHNANVKIIKKTHAFEANNAVWTHNIIEGSSQE